MPIKNLLLTSECNNFLISWMLTSDRRKDKTILLISIRLCLLNINSVSFVSLICSETPYNKT